MKFVEPKPAKDSSSSADEEDSPPSDAITEPQLDKEGKPAFKSSPIRLDPVKQEGLNILADLVDLSKSEGVATAKRK